MKIKVLEDTPNLVRVALAGSFDPEGEGWGAKLMALAAPAGQDLIVDVSAVTHLVSIDLGTLVSAARLVERKRAKFVLLKPNPGVSTTLETLGMKDLLNVAMDEEAAQAILAGG